MADPTQISTSWTAPPLSSLRITDCSAATDWFASRVHKIDDGNATWLDGSLETGTSLLGSLVPDDWTPRPSRTDLAVWYIEVWTAVDDGEDPELPRLRDEIRDFSLNQCGTDICSKLQWEGDGDVSGIGMVLSYYIVASLSTLYFIILAPLRVGLYDHRTLPNTLGRLVTGCRDSLVVFLETALLFSIGMGASAVVRYAAVRRDVEDDYSVFGLLSSAIMSAFAIFPAVALQAVSDGLRRSFLRQFLWFLVIGLTISLEVLYRLFFDAGKPNADRNDYNAFFSRDDQYNQNIWLTACEGDYWRPRIQQALTAAHVNLGVNVLWWLYYVVVSFVDFHMLPLWLQRWMNSHRIRERWKRVKPWLRMAGGAMSLAIMWTCLVFFTLYRFHVGNLSGQANEDDKWTFGQVLALSAWIPPVYAFFDVYIDGPEKAWTKKLPKRYEAKEVRDLGEKKKKSSMESFHYGNVDVADKHQHQMWPSNKIHSIV